MNGHDWLGKPDLLQITLSLLDGFWFEATRLATGTGTSYPGAYLGGAVDEDLFFGFYLILGQKPD